MAASPGWKTAHVRRPAPHEARSGDEPEEVSPADLAADLAARARGAITRPD